MKSVGIIGFGRFGKVLANILQKGFIIKVYDPDDNENISGVRMLSLDEVLKESAIFIAVPIRKFNHLIEEIAPELIKGTTIIDVCSVKQYPIEIMKKNLPQNIGIIGTHPMFGPDSFFSNSHLKMMMNNTRDINGQFSFWVQYFSDQGIEIVQMSPEEHDELAAETQGVTHYLGRMLKEYGIQKTKIDTKGFRDLLDLVDQTCNDTWDLYNDLQSYNPYTKQMINKLKTATNKLDKRLEDQKNVEN